MFNPSTSQPYAKRQRFSNSNDPPADIRKRQTPSKVIHIRNLNESVGELDLKRDLQKYGQINKVLFMFKKRQALIEYNDIQSAMRCVTDAIRSNVKIAGTTAFINYSQYSNLVKNGENQVESSGGEDENHILSFTVQNPLYPINVDVMNTICSPFGKILRILLFRKNGVQAMVEFENIDSARRAKDSLDNADIYTGCCTLKIEFAKGASGLNVHKNDPESGWDYTTSSSAGYNSNKNIISQEMSNSDYNNGNSGNSYGASNSQIPSLMASNSSSERQNSNTIILMINNLCSSKFNCDRLFNLLCLYGNVDGIKFLLTKEGSAISQMSNAEMILTLLPNFNNTYMFGRKLQMNVSDQYVFKPVAKPANLADGTPSYKDYTNSRNNRYTTSELAQRNKPIAPTSVLHWYSVPPGYDQNQVTNLFVNAGAKAPVKIKIFQKKTDKSTSGLAEWNAVSEACEALVLTNHTEISHQSSKFPYTLKLCFTTTPIMDGSN